MRGIDFCIRILHQTRRHIGLCVRYLSNKGSVCSGLSMSGSRYRRTILHVILADGEASWKEEEVFRRKFRDAF